MHAGQGVRAQAGRYGAAWVITLVVALLALVGAQGASGGFRDTTYRAQQAELVRDARGTVLVMQLVRGGVMQVADPVVAPDFEEQLVLAKATHGTICILITDQGAGRVGAAVAADDRCAVEIMLPMVFTSPHRLAGGSGG